VYVRFAQALGMRQKRAYNFVKLQLRVDEEESRENVGSMLSAAPPCFSVAVESQARSISGERVWNLIDRPQAPEVGTTIHRS
jgi:hypothetical protein